MPFTNRIRLPFKVTRAQFPETKTVFRLANGTTKVQSVIIQKTYEGETDWLSEKWHERLNIALGHDNVTIEGDKYLGGISKDGDYEIDWPDFLDYPTAKAKFVVQVTPFDNTNSNCQTCEEANQLSLVNDTFPADLVENTDYTLNIATNDNICCWPSVFSITSYNSDFIDPPTIDTNGLLHIHTKAHFETSVGIKLLTYRVTCPNASFDEADVFADLTGDEPSCLAPSNIVISSITANAAHVSFTPAGGPPNHYLWRLYKASAPGVLVQTGTSTTAFDITGLDADTDYIIYIRSQCGAGNDDATASNFINAPLTTANSSTLCGNYTIGYDNFDAFPLPTMTINYIDCSGNNQHIFLRNHNTTDICALQTSPGSPVSIVTTQPSNTSLTYNGTC